MSYTKREGDQVIDGKSGEKVTGVSHGSAPHAASVRRASSESDVCGRFRGEDTVAYSLSQDTPADHAETRGRDTANQNTSEQSEESQTATKSRGAATSKSQPKHQDVVNAQPQPTPAPQIAGGAPAQSEEIGRRILSDLPDRTEPISFSRQHPDEYPTHTLVQKVLAAPLRLPVCMCDCIGYTTNICNGALWTFISDSEVTLRGIVRDPEPDPGCCTKGVGMSLPSGACPAFNRQDYPAARRQPRAGMMCAGIFCWPLFRPCQIVPMLVCLPCCLCQGVCGKC
ncbi:hypothetical protein B0H13DRAFT_2076566 [Mycena leptocephala]|nr:hypothetical protein B0H13DRAFT_2076566 [Mycena leptocephala]